MGGRVLLELEDAEVVRDGRTILHVEHFVLHEGERVAILGPNGAGKSTLVGLLARDVMPLWRDPYPVRFFGQERASLDEVRGVVGVVSAAWQEIVDVHLTVREVVLGGRFGSLGVPPHLRSRVTAEDITATDSAIRELGIEPLAQRDMQTLSTGEARRALIARSLVHDPAVLVFDEPAAGLDPTAAWHLRESIRSLSRGGRTLMLVTHHVEDIVREFDRVVMVFDGRIVADGPKAEVLSSERMSLLFDVPLELEERGGEYRLW